MLLIAKVWKAFDRDASPSPLIGAVIWSAPLVALENLHIPVHGAIESQDLERAVCSGNEPETVDSFGRKVGFFLQAVCAPKLMERLDNQLVKDFLSIDEGENEAPLEHPLPQAYIDLEGDTALQVMHNITPSDLATLKRLCFPMNDTNVREGICIGF